MRYDERGNETRTNWMEQNETKSFGKMKKNLGVFFEKGPKMFFLSLNEVFFMANENGTGNELQPV